MKRIPLSLLAVASGLLVSCFGEDEPPEAADVNPPPARDPRPDRPPPPPQPQDGSMIVRPGGTGAHKPAAPAVSEEDKSDAISAAEREIARRRQDTEEADDLVSKALKNVSDDDLDKAFSELKKAVDKYPNTGQ